MKLQGKTELQAKSIFFFVDDVVVGVNVFCMENQNTINYTRNDSNINCVNKHSMNRTIDTHRSKCKRNTHTQLNGKYFTDASQSNEGEIQSAAHFIHRVCAQ